MAKKVMVTTESASDLSKELIERYNIKIVPLGINLGDDSRIDGVDVFPKDIYEYVEKTSKIPTTSAVAPMQYTEFFEPFLKDGYEIIHVCISSRISSCYQNAVIAASELEGVQVVDSLSLSTGIGLLAIEAAVMAQDGKNVSEIKQRLDELKTKLQVSFVLNTLTYLHKGGRCSAVAVLGANLLKLRPCIEMTGSMGVGKKYRGAHMDVLLEYVKNKLEQFPKVKKDRIFITHSGIDREFIDAVQDYIKSQNLFDEILITTAGSTISNHCGPGTLGILYIYE